LNVLKGYDFDDLLLIPRLSTVNSRDDVDLSVEITKDLILRIPIIASPMKGITSKELIVKLAKLGGIGIVHRFFDNLHSLEKEYNYIADRTNNWGAAIGINEIEKLDLALFYGAKIICVDVANGYTESLKHFVRQVADYILSKNNNAVVMAGNVVTEDGFYSLASNGATLVRVGIGNGGLCTTRNITGVGIPQLTAVELCTATALSSICVSDGGIRNSGDAVKVLAMGAKLVMLGSLLGQTYESSHNGVIYGMASRKLQEEYYHGVKSVEGIEKIQEKKMSLEDFIKEFTYGIRSAMTYMNAQDLSELRLHAKFVETGTGSIKPA
jgi:IMP dehydrogenase